LVLVARKQTVGGELNRRKFDAKEALRWSILRHQGKGVRGLWQLCESAQQTVSVATLTRLDRYGATLPGAAPEYLLSPRVPVHAGDRVDDWLADSSAQLSPTILSVTLFVPNQQIWLFPGTFGRQRFPKPSATSSSTGCKGVNPCGAVGKSFCTGSGSAPRRSIEAVQALAAAKQRRRAEPIYVIEL
jgi:hypothetical protein